MDYPDARRLVPGTTVCTDFGDLGEVLTLQDTGSSVIVGVRRADGRVLDVLSAHLWCAPPMQAGRGEVPVRPGYYRVLWAVDLPKDEFASPRAAAEHASELAGDCSGPVNMFRVLDGDDGAETEHDLAP
jgi:hypothetical protein